MNRPTKLNAIARYAWLVLGWNVVVILWGVFLRASKSGDGCGQHWLTCNGEVIPSAPELKTVIEFSHRITSSLAGIFIIILAAWAFYAWRKTRGPQEWLTLKMATGSLIFVIIEGLLGRSLVLTGNTAMNLTPERPFWMAGHLINTFILITFLTLTARYASGGRRIRLGGDGKARAPLLVGVVVIFLVGVTGSIAALSSMIFPSNTVVEGVAKDFSETSNVLLRLRLLHPITAIFTSVFLILLAGWLARLYANDNQVKRSTNTLSIVVLAQIAFGAATLLTLAPILMQLGHLLLADLIWISYVLTSANVLSSEPSAFTSAPLAAAFDEAVE